VFASPLSRATHSSEFVPCVVPLEMAPDPLQAFASERSPSRITTCGPESRPVIEPRPAPRRWGVRIRVPAWLGTSSLAILGGALSGLLIATTYEVQQPMLPAGGAVTITSEPTGLPIRVDGLARGVTPFASMLAAGGHRIEIGATDTSTRYLRVRAGTEASLHVVGPQMGPQMTQIEPQMTQPQMTQIEPQMTQITQVAQPQMTQTTQTTQMTQMAQHAQTGTRSQTSALAPRPLPAPTGSLAVSSPFPVRVLVDGEEVGASTTPRLVVPAGAHTVTLVNERLEFEQEMALEIAARRTASVTVEAPSGTLHLNARPWAQVWIDGRRAGDTPLGNVTLPIGEHEVVLRHPDLGEQRRTVTVGARTPVHVGVELAR
jgi:hypothetical protein